VRRTSWATTELTCERCGCSETNACVVLDKEGTFRGCHWDTTAPGTTCSACSGADRRVRGPNQ
jgi:hypothetical protein